MRSPRRPSTRLGAVLCLLPLALLAGCGGSDPKLADLPPDVASARPSITQDEARFVLAGNERGADITGGTVDDDIESGKAICWALANGGVQLKDMVAQLTAEEAPRTAVLMAAAVPAFCPDYDSQLAQLGSVPSST